MMRFILPVILVVAALGLFIVYINPTYQHTKVLNEQYAQYDTVLTQSSQVRQKRDTLLSERNTIPADDLQAIGRLLPDNIDNIRLIIDINDIAARYHLQVANVSVGSSPDQVGASSGVGSVDLGFAVAATYSDFLAFLFDLERSLRIVDIESISFTAPTTTLGTATYTVHVKTYWLR